MDETTTSTACCTDFAIDYAQAAHPAMRRLERRVLGCDFGGTSYTTRTQAEEIPGLLGLGEGVRMLEIGSGSGWPGLYLARASRCRAILLDIPLIALQQATQRASEERVAERTAAVLGSCARLPFPTSSFDAIGHSDVLCCLPEKLETLKECRRVARPGAKMLFYVILPAQGLTGRELETAIVAGPPFVAVPGDYGTLLERSGWRLIEREDVTESYGRALRGLVKGLESAADDLQEALGRDAHSELLVRRRRQVRAVEKGLLAREKFLATTA